MTRLVPTRLLSYLSGFSIALVLCSVLVLTFSYLLDPFWYFRGNQLGAYNVRFDERVSKTNQFLKHSNKIDCLIFGSSRVTLLHASKITEYDCFNYSFSAGFIAEHIDFAQYASSFISDLKVLIVGVEEFNFRPFPELNIPDFVLDKERPDLWFSKYLSLDAIKFSIRVWRGGEFSRQYDANFEGVEVRRYDYPENEQRWTEIERIRSDRVYAASNQAEPFSADHISQYAKLNAVFPDAVHIGYVPPVGADWIVLWHESGILDSYLEVVYEVSSMYEVFIDFSIPSLVTIDPSNTFDGSHFYPEINDRVARTLMGEEIVEGFGVNVKAIDFDEYTRLYMDRIRSVQAGRSN